MSAISNSAVAENAPTTTIRGDKLGVLSIVWTTTLFLGLMIALFTQTQLKSIQAEQTTAYENVLVNLVRVNEEHAMRTFRSADLALQLMMHQYAKLGSQFNITQMTDAGLIDDKLFAALVIIDSKGIVKLSNRHFDAGLSLADRPHFKVHVAVNTRESYISVPVMGRVSKKTSLILSRRINNPDGSFGGVAVAAIDVNYFNSFYNSLVLPAKSSAVLSGLDGIIRARQFDDESSSGQNITLSPMFKMIADGNRSSRFAAKSLINGAERVYFYRTIPSFPLVVYISYDPNSLRALHVQASQLIYLQGALGLLILVFVSGMISFYFVRLQNELTHRHRLTIQLQTSEERWNLAVSGSDEGVWDWHSEAGSMFLSGKLCALLGYMDSPSGVTLGDSLKDNEIVYRWKNGVHPDDLAKLKQQMVRHFKGEAEFLRIELRARCKDGSYRWVLIRGRALRDENGRAFRMTGSLADFSQTYDERIQIKDQNDRLNTIFALSPDALVSFDESYRVNYANPAFEELTGLTAASVTSLTEHELTEKINGLCAPEHLFEGLDALRQLPGATALKQRLLIELAVPVRRVLQAMLRNSESTSSPQILYLRDVTHETIVEEMKTEFLSTAAHELRTPMASILGFSEVLLTHQVDAAQHKEFLTIIHAQSQQMSSILDDLLDLARIEARQSQDFVFETLSLPLMVDEVVKGFNLPLGRSVPAVVIPPDASFRADQGKAKQVILNVLSNAYKYSPPESTVTINFVALHHESKGLLCGISIQDQGYGMTSEQLDRVFERFYRAETTGKTPGTGLGMSIAKEIMESHGGEILVESDFGVGTLVTLLFPSANQQDLQGPADGPD